MRLRSIKAAGLLACGFGILLIAVVLLGLPHRAGLPVGTPARLALLVGCTQYQHPRIPELYGPANDVRLFADLLRTQFGFTDAEMVQLSGWPSDSRRRPTCANITAGFETLIERAGEATQVVILMAGHGVQVPIPESQLDPLDPRNPEPDGMDEVFLPADARSFTRDGLENAIRDDQFGVWLDRLRDKGALVWIVFDCCHAGDMARGDLERPRFIDPQVLGVTPELVENARARAHAAALKQSAGSVPVPHGLAQMPARTDAAKGSVVAFYAAQSFEKAPELPCPDDAPRTKENYFGLLSYNLTAVLGQTEHAVTYRELAQALVGRYDAERGQRGPTPGFDGDLDRVVLGADKRPGRSHLILENAGGTLTINGGVLRGLTPGSVLAVQPPASDADEVLGHVRIVRAAIDRAEVAPCPAPDGTAAVAADRLPNHGRCRIVSRDLGEMRLKLFVRAATANERAAAKRVRSALDAIEPAYRELFVEIDDEAAADWVLWVDRDDVKLHAGAGVAMLVDQPAVARKVYARYPLPPDPAVLAHDLQAIFTWRNLWRIAGVTACQPAAADRPRLELSAHRCKKVDGKLVADGPFPSGTALRPHQDGLVVQFNMKNHGPQHLWVTILALDPSMAITQVNSLALKAGDSFAQQGTITNQRHGKECVVVLAEPQDRKRSQPNYTFLQQDGLDAESHAPLARSIGLAPHSPFGELLQTAALGKGRRSIDLSAPNNPQVLLWSWTTLAAAP
jgi:hypothetical protein